jgi:hypothetical protein
VREVSENDEVKGEFLIAKVDMEANLHLAIKSSPPLHSTTYSSAATNRN